MTAGQLQAARAAHWRQKQNPILTLEDAQSWIEQHPLCLFLPRKAQMPAPAPSFVEAVLGESNPTPPVAAIEQARALLMRLIDSGHVAALNLFGDLGEQPDFVAQTEILPFAVSFRGERDWRQPPGKTGGPKVSPLVFDLWKLLEKEGPLTASAVREKLGRELTEAAVMRALSELWQTLRVLPTLQAEGKPALWALTQHHYRAALTKASSTSQVTAISLLVSMYLQSVYAATNEEIEIFLSPLVSRSRIREAVRGLAATRQIQSLSMGAQTYYFLEGGLPEFAPQPQPERAEPARTPRNIPSFGRSFDRSANRPSAPRPLGPPRPGGRPAGDWKRKSAAPGATPKPPGTKWRTFPQPGEQAPDQRGGQNRPPERRGGEAPNRPPWKKPRWDRNRPPAAPLHPFNPQSKGARAPGGAARRDPASRPPDRTNDRGNRDREKRGGKSGQGFSPPQRRSGAPGQRTEARPTQAQPSPARSPQDRPVRDMPQGEGRPTGGGPGGFKPRGFDSRTRSGRPQFGKKFAKKSAGKPKSGFRGRNQGKKKPEA